MPANDEPHGVFALNPEQQSIAVVWKGPEVNRVLVLNITRLAGVFGNASVGYRITGGIEGGVAMEEILEGGGEGRVLLREGETFSVVEVPIRSQVRQRKMQIKAFTSLLRCFSLTGASLVCVGVPVSWGELHCRAD